MGYGRITADPMVLWALAHTPLLKSRRPGSRATIYMTTWQVVRVLVCVCYPTEGPSAIHRELDNGWFTRA